MIMSQTRIPSPAPGLHFSLTKMAVSTSLLITTHSQILISLLDEEISALPSPSIVPFLPLYSLNSTDLTGDLGSTECDSPHGQ